MIKSKSPKTDAAKVYIEVDRDFCGGYYQWVVPVDVCRGIEIAAEEADRARSQECVLGVGDGSGTMFVRGEYDAIKRVQQMIFRLEELERKERERNRE